MRATSPGAEMIASPWRANSSTMVNSSPYSAQGPIFGRNRSSYQVRPLARSPRMRVRNPATSGIPRKISTLRTIAPIENSADVVGSPSQDGSAWR